MSKDSGALVQLAVDLEAVGKEIDELLTQERRGSAAVETANKILTNWRYKAGLLFAQVRKTFPASGPKAAGWAKFCEARGVSKDSAARYIELAEQVSQQPELALGGKTIADLYRELNLNTLPPSQRSLSTFDAPNYTALRQNDAATKPLAPDYMRRLALGRLTRQEVIDRCKRLSGPEMDAELAEARRQIQGEQAEAAPRTYQPVLDGPEGKALAGKPLKTRTPQPKEEEPDAEDELPDLSEATARADRAAATHVVPAPQVLRAEVPSGRPAGAAAPDEVDEEPAPVMRAAIPPARPADQVAVHVVPPGQVRGGDLQEVAGYLAGLLSQDLPDRPLDAEAVCRLIDAWGKEAAARGAAHGETTALVWAGGLVGLDFDEDAAADDIRADIEKEIEERHQMRLRRHDEAQAEAERLRKEVRNLGAQLKAAEEPHREAKLARVGSKREALPAGLPRANDVLSVACPKCGAAAGDGCKNYKKKGCAPHGDRFKAAAKGRA